MKRPQWDSKTKAKIVLEELSGKPVNETVAAISGLNGKELNGRALNVNEAKPRPQNGNHSGGNGYRRSY